MFRTLLTHAVLPAALIMPMASYASTGPQFCSFDHEHWIGPGETFASTVSVRSGRSQNPNTRVEFYFSTTPQIDNASVLLGVRDIPTPTDFSCSALNRVDLRLPSTTHASSCFDPSSGYIIARTNDDVAPREVALKDAHLLPLITRTTPREGRPGSLIHVLGENLERADIHLDNQQMAQALVGNDLLGIVSANHNSGSVSVEHNQYNYCVPPGAVGDSFTVLPSGQYCHSGAANPGFGRISQVAMNGFNNDLSSSVACPTYTDTTTNGIYGLTRKEKAGESLYFKFNACGETAYNRMMKIFVDWNNDLDFTDAGELLFEAPFVGVDSLYQLKFDVPATAKAGTTRMRIISALYFNGSIDSLNDLDSCGTYPYGETHDYNIDLVPSNYGLTALFAKTGEPLNDESLKELVETGSLKAAEESDSALAPLPKNTLLVDGKPAVLAPTGENIR